MEVASLARGARIFAGLIAALTLAGCRTAGIPAAGDPAVVRALIRAQADSLDAALARLGVALATTPLDSSRVRGAFADARTAYKHVEGVVEFYAPAVAASLNSRRQEVDDDDAPPPSTLSAAGFPAVEGLLWPNVTPASTREASVAVNEMRGAAHRIRTIADASVPSTAQITEIARQELARVSTLGIAGFDAPVTHDAMRESADAIDGLRALLGADRARWREADAEYRRADQSLADAATALRAHPDFDTFERLPFLAQRAIPAAHAVETLRRAAGARSVSIQRFWRDGSASPYDAHAFDTRVFAAAEAARPTPEILALGERLFHETALSGPGTRSCASCHVPGHVFTDGVARQASIDGRGMVRRHTPSLINAALSPAYFADERAPSLEEQVVRVLESPTEMGSSIERAATTLGAMPRYRTEFARAFGVPDPVTPARLRQALAAYVRSLVALDARFDRAVRGDVALLDASERRGFDLYMGKAGCGTCHFAPLFNGTTPPLYRNADVEVVGVPAAPNDLRALDADGGRGDVDHLPLHRRAFKTPSLRNATLTGPYFHHGAFGTMRSVIDFYDRGGGVGGGARVPNQTLSAERLHLTVQEKHDIEAFLGTLVDTTIVARSTR